MKLKELFIRIIVSNYNSFFRGKNEKRKGSNPFKGWNNKDKRNQKINTGRWFY